MSNATELRLNRRNTVAFIERNPADIAFVPYTKERTSSGGQAWVPGAARPTQRVRVVDQSSGAGPAQGPQTNGDGRGRSLEQVLVGRWDATWAVDDRFTYAGKPYEIVELFGDNGYERRAVVRARGEGS